MLSIVVNIKTSPHVNRTFLQVDAYLNKRREREARLAASLNMEPNRCCLQPSISMSLDLPNMLFFYRVTKNITLQQYYWEKSLLFSPEVLGANGFNSGRR